MSSLLEQLQNNEAILLMYLADELPAEDRAEVEQMLQTDENLRRELARLQDAEEVVHASLKDADKKNPLPIPLPSLQRQVSRLYSHWQVEQLSAPEAVVPENRKRHWTSWAIPAATAAMILIGVLIWAGLRDHGNTNELGGRFPEYDDPSSANDVQFALLRSFDNYDEIQLRDVEAQLQTITERREDLSPVLSLEGSIR